MSRQRAAAELSAPQAITVIFRVNGVEQNPISAPPYAMKYFVPYTSVETAPSLKISATATNTFGGSESEIDLLSADIVRNVTTVNIDNGYGAACAALRVLQPHRTQATKTAD